MPLLLDTVTCSASLKAQPEAGIHSRLIQHGGQISISRLSCAELYALGYRTGAKKLEQIDDLLNEWNVLNSTAFAPENMAGCTLGWQSMVKVPGKST
jgi:predicted nucleic acid-binding protein